VQAQNTLAKGGAMGTSAQSTEKDPVLLGVSVPLGVTVSAAKEVGTAWREFGMNLLQAIKQQKETIGKSTSKSAGAKTGASDNLDGGASSSANVSA
jgi:hypothetical protein